MVLVGHRNALYFSQKKYRSKSGGNFFMSKDTEFLPNNGLVLTIAKTIKAVISSAVEAELGTLLINCKEDIPARQALE